MHTCPYNLDAMHSSSRFHRKSSSNVYSMDSPGAEASVVKDLFDVNAVHSRNVSSDIGRASPIDEECLGVDDQLMQQLEDGVGNQIVLDEGSTCVGTLPSRPCALALGSPSQQLGSQLSGLRLPSAALHRRHNSADSRHSIHKGM